MSDKATNNREFMVETGRAIPVDQILCGDSAELLKQLPDNSVDLVITSPPYYKQRIYNGRKFGIGRESTAEQYLDALLNTFEEVIRVVKPVGNIVYNLGDKYIKGSLQLLPYQFALAASAKFPVRLVNDITWIKDNPTPRQFTRRLVPSTESFFHFAKGSNYYYSRKQFLEGEDSTPKRHRPSPRLGQGYRNLIDNSELDEESRRKAHAELDKVIQEVHSGELSGFRMKIRGVHAEAFGGEDGGRKIQIEKNGFTIIRMRGEKIKRDVINSPVESLPGNEHTAVFPIKVIREIIRLLSPIDGIVLDPYMGSGTTALAALIEKRHYMGMEIDPLYCANAKCRISNWEKETENERSVRPAEKFS